tara:strand:- start:1500 stop:3332 length:1833 start_codon:yes stop_codon:yes gene_type:complete
MREHRRTPKKRKRGGGTRNKRHRGGAEASSAEANPAEASPEEASPAELAAEQEVGVASLSETAGEEQLENPSEEQGTRTKVSLEDPGDNIINFHIEKDNLVIPVYFKDEKYIKYINFKNCDALDKLSKIMYSALLNKHHEYVKEQIDGSLRSYKDKDINSGIKGIIRNLEEIEKRVNDLKNKIDEYSREPNVDVVNFYKEIMSTDDVYFEGKEDFKGMFVNIVNEFNSGIIGFRGNKVSSQIFKKEEKEMKKKKVTEFELNKFYLFNIIDFMIFMGIKLKEELEEYLEAINQLIQFNNDIATLQTNIEKEEEVANEKNKTIVALRELFKDEGDVEEKKKKEFILKKVVDQMNGIDLIVELKSLKSLMVEKKELITDRGDSGEEITRIQKQIDVKQTELMEEIQKFKLEDNDGITEKFQKKIDSLDESKITEENDKQKGVTIKVLLQKLVDQKKRLEQKSKTQREGTAEAGPTPSGEEIQKINTNIDGIMGDLKKSFDNPTEQHGGPLFDHYYYVPKAIALGYLLRYQIDLHSSSNNNLQSFIEFLEPLADPSNPEYDIKVFFRKIVEVVYKEIVDKGTVDLTAAAISSQKIITEFLSGSDTISDEGEEEE